MGSAAPRSSTLRLFSLFWWWLQQLQLLMEIMTMMSMRNMVGMSLRREKLNQDMQAEVMEEDIVATAEAIVVVTAEDMVDTVAVTMVKDLLNQDTVMVVIVDVLAHMVDMVVDVDMVVIVEAIAHMVVAMEVGMVDMVEVTMERERLDMVAMEGVMGEVMVEVMAEATL